MDLTPFIVKPGKKVRLTDFATDATPAVKDKEDARERLEKNLEAIADLQERLYADNREGVLVVLQAMDAAGKDSTIKHVMSGLNPQGVLVTSFKAPTAGELDHDYLWRSVVALPGRGMIGIHNRSHYEEVLITRVHPEILARQRLPERTKRGDIIERRYREINNFEQSLYDNGFTVVKLFLHVSRNEQRDRLLRRLERPDKHWKFELQDLKERALWRDYVKAYEQAFTHTSTETAPWYVVPADRKWYLHLAVSEILLKTLRGLKIDMPKLTKQDLEEINEGKRLLKVEEKEQKKNKN